MHCSEVTSYFILLYIYSRISNKVLNTFVCLNEIIVENVSITLFRVKANQ